MYGHTWLKWRLEALQPHMATIFNSEQHHHHPFIWLLSHCSMPLTALKTVAKGQVMHSTSPVPYQCLTRNLEWRRRLHSPMQTARLPLLRLGRVLTRDESVPQAPPTRLRKGESPNRNPRFAAPEPAPHHPRALYQRE